MRAAIVSGKIHYTIAHAVYYSYSGTLAMKKGMVEYNLVPRPFERGDEKAIAYACAIFETGKAHGWIMRSYGKLLYTTVFARQYSAW